MGIQPHARRITDQAMKMKRGQNKYLARPTLPWGWIGFFSSIILLALISSFALISVGKQFVGSELPEHSLLRVIIDGKTYHVPEHAQAELVSRTKQIIRHQQTQVSRQTQQHIDQLLDDAFAPVHARIPEFADWYYSLTAEYLLYANAISGDIAVYLQDQLMLRVFQPARLEQSIDNLAASTNDSLRRLLGESRQSAMRQIQSVTAEHAIQAQPEMSDITAQLDLDAMMSVAPDLNQNAINRQLVSVVAATGIGVAAGKGVGALAVKKTLVKITGNKSFLAAGGLLAKLAGKSALKGGGVLAATASGMVICSPGGPGALMCGAVAGLAAWVAVDAAAISLDEMLNRETFEADMHQVVNEQQKKLSSAYSDAYSALISSYFSSLQQTVYPPLHPPATFVPAQTLMH